MRAYLRSLPLILSMMIMIAVTNQNPTVKLNITGFENDEGMAIVRVFNSADGFPKDETKVYARYKAVIKNKKSYAEIKDLVPGTYAITVFHDEDNDGEIDKNWIGMPNEAMGASNYPELERPVFEKAKFTIKSAQTITLDIFVDTIF